MKIRLLTTVQLDALRDTSLHDRVGRRHAPEIKVATEGILRGLGDAPFVTLETLQKLVETHLREIPAVRSLVKDEAQLRGTPLDEDGFFEALALWIIERQVGEAALVWDAQRPPKPRSRFRWPRVS